MDRRLQLVEGQIQSLKEVEQEVEANAKKQSKGSDKPHRTLPKTPTPTSSLEEKFPDYVRKDGKVNAKQILDMLHSKEKQQEKVVYGGMKCKMKPRNT